MMLCRLGRGHSIIRFSSRASYRNRFFHNATILSSIQVKMPSLSPTMQEGQVVKWLKAAGEAVNAGDVLCDIQTDKAVVSLESDEDGTMAKIIKDCDDGTVKVGTLIAIIAEEGEDWKAVAASDCHVLIDGDQVSAESSSAPSAAPQSSAGSIPGSEIKMPALSPTMVEGTIVKWCYEEGDVIKTGEVLCEIQTDKAVVSVEVDEDAVLAKIMLAEGTSNVKIGTVIALTVDEGEDWKDVQLPAQESSPATVSDEAPSSAAPLVPEATEFRAVQHVSVPGAGPATNLLLAQYGIDAGTMTPTGPKGLTKADVLAHVHREGLKPLEQQKATVDQDKKIKRPDFTRPASATRVAMALEDKSPTAKQGYSSYIDIPLSSIRSVIAKRLLLSKQTAPHGYATTECNIDAMAKIRDDFSSTSEGAKISVNDVVIKAVSSTLQCLPQVNLNTVGDQDFRVMPNVDISVAVATPSGLITPIVKNVPSLSLREISGTVREMAARAKEGKLQPDEFQGGTFTISNLGMLGISEFTAIINPPQCAILAVGRGIEEINPSTGKPSTYMRATLSFDRRFIDESLASDFVSTFRRIVEQPEYMNLGLEPLVRKSARIEG